MFIITRSSIFLLGVSLLSASCSFLPPVRTKGSVVALSGASVVIEESKARTLVKTDEETTLASPTSLGASSITVPAGALSEAGTLVIEVAEDIAKSDVLADVGVAGSSVGAVSPGLIIRPDSSTVSLNGQLSITMDVPKASLRLAGDQKQYVIFYKQILPSGGLFSGVIPFSQLTVKNGQLIFAGYFGSYWAAEALAEIPEVKTQASTPIVNKDAVPVVEKSGTVVSDEVIVKKTYLPSADMNIFVERSGENFTVILTNKNPFAAVYSIAACSVRLYDSLSTEYKVFTTTGDGVTFKATGELPKKRERSWDIGVRASCEDSNGKKYVVVYEHAFVLEANYVPTPVSTDDNLPEITQTPPSGPSVDGTPPPTSAPGASNGPLFFEGPGPVSVVMNPSTDLSSYLNLVAHIDTTATSFTWNVESRPAGANAIVIAQGGENNLVLIGGVYYNRKEAIFAADINGIYKLRMTVNSSVGSSFIDFDVNWQKNHPTILIKDSLLSTKTPSVSVQNHIIGLGTSGTILLWEEVVWNGTDYTPSSGGLAFSDSSSLAPVVAIAGNGEYAMRLTITKDGVSATAGVININYDSVAPVLAAQTSPVFFNMPTGQCMTIFRSYAGNFEVNDSSDVALRFTPTSGPSSIVTMNMDGLNQCINFAGGNGVYGFDVQAIDAAGNISAPVPYQITVDNIAPAPETRIVSVSQVDWLDAGMPRVKFKFTLNRPLQDIHSGEIRLVQINDPCVGVAPAFVIPYTEAIFSGVATADFYSYPLYTTDSYKICWEDRDRAGNTAGVFDFGYIGVDNTPPTASISWLNAVAPPSYTTSGSFPPVSDPSFTISELTGTNPQTVGYKLKLFIASQSSDLPECDDATMMMNTAAFGTLQSSYVAPSLTSYYNNFTDSGVANTYPGNYYRLCVQFVTGAAVKTTITAAQWYRP